MIIQQTQIVDAASMAALVNSVGIHMNIFNGASITNCSIQAVMSGAPVGTLKLQISNDPVDVPMNDNQGTDNPDYNPAVNVVNWSDYTGSTYAVTTAGT